MPEFSGITQRSVAISGHETRYLRSGSGRPVVLIHGSGAGVSAAANWWPTINPLAEHYDVIAPDLFGFGASANSEDLPYGIGLWADQIVELIARLELADPVLVGNSLGGWVALDVARHHRDLLRGLVLMGTGGTPQSATRAIRQHRRYEPGLDAMRQLLTDFVHDREHVTDALVMERYEASRAPGAEAAYAKTTAARARDREERPVDPDALRDLDIPALLIHGKEDRIIPCTSSESLAKVMQAADLHLFARCGHWTQIEYPRKFNALVLQFLDELDRAA
ncbi:alpha/beta fold hydrolase [Spirillospora sp. NPDC048819]|uniref:alpha/beta fold hydrolase n=1 Tax=Spirillospora sp. NPDC048819 TaxID=3155268 RepID=UPI0033F80C8D